MTTSEEMAALRAGALAASSLPHDADEIVVIDEPAVPPRPTRSELAEERRLEAEAEINRLVHAELLDRFACELAPAVFTVLHELGCGGPVQPQDFSRELWRFARAAAEGRPS